MAATRSRSKKLMGKPGAAAARLLELSIPSHFRCPISLDLMKDPVTVSTGITYDRHSIETWLDTGSSTCPVTNQQLVADEVIPNHSLRRLIQDWCVANRSHGVERIPTPKIPVSMAQASQILSEISCSPTRARARELAVKVGAMARESERNRRSFADAGAARIIAGLFSENAGKNSTTMEEILSTMACFLPLDDNQARRYLGSRQSLQSLVSILESGDLAARLNAVAVVREVISARKETIVAAAAETEGLIEALVEVIRKPISPRATKAALAACFVLISSDETKETASSRLVELGLVPLVLEVLVESDKAVCEKALALLDALCGSERGREAARGHALTMPVLVKKMFRVSDAASELVVSAMWKLCKNSGRGEENEANAVVAEAAQVGAFQKLLLLLQVGCGGATKEKATEMLKMMNGYKGKLECIDVMDLRGLKRSA